MNIGIIGKGVIGTANFEGFEYLGHSVLAHDLRLGTSIELLLQTEIIFVCVPTPNTLDGACDVSNVESVIAELNDLDYRGIVAIRSTVIPGTTERLQKLYNNLQIAYVPEFLRERSARSDFIENHSLLAIGALEQHVIDVIKECHSHLPENIEVMSPTEAECLKYFNNVFAALRITFANNIYTVCEKLGADYNKVKSAYVKTGKLGDVYLDVTDDLRGYSGPCLPKDTLAFAKLMNELNINLGLIKQVHEDNLKMKPTVLPGMRSS